MLRDPVCGKRMNRAKAHIVIEFEGIAYSLCCPLCQREFERSPESFVKPEWGRPVKRKRGNGRQAQRRQRSRTP